MSDLLQRVRKIEIKARGLSRHLFAGGYQSAFKGRGMSFSEVRQYQYGDDIRHIDWNVTARTGEPYVKVYEEERELNVMLLVDVSASAFFGATAPKKMEYLTEICALLAFSADANQDKVGLLLFAGGEDVFMAPAKGRQHTLGIIRRLLVAQDAALPTDLSLALQFTHRALKKRSICFILSDFWASGYERALRILAKHHDCIGIHAWDERERLLPDVSLVRAQDAETGAEAWIDTTDPDFRKEYTLRFDRHRADTEQLFRRAGADFLSLNTGRPFIGDLMRLFAERARHGG